MKTDKKIYWTMRSGQKIDIDEMSIDHLRNTLKMIVRNIEASHRKHEKKPFTLNGDMANEFNGDPYDR